MRPDPDTPEAWLAYAKSDLTLAAAAIPGVMRGELLFSRTTGGGEEPESCADFPKGCLSEDA
jgi:hypothetical protein